MSERKVLNKYYPPDFDPTKIPRSKAGRNKQFTVRLMAPCNMRCNTCGEYIYKGKKFNARKEDVENQDYLGLRIYRFYIKCTRCIADICFKTDPESCDYIIEAGATRNFMALKLAEEQAEREEAAEKEDEATNPMKVLEKRTQASRHEMAVLEALEELKELNQRQITPDMLHQKILGVGDTDAEEAEAKRLQREEAEDEAFVQSIFGKEATGPLIRRIEDSSDSDDSGEEASSAKNAKKFKPSVSDFLVDHLAPVQGSSSTSASSSSWKPKSLTQKPLVLVKPKAKVAAVATVTSESKISKPEIAVAKVPTATAVTGLSLLGSYGSDTDSE